MIYSSKELAQTIVEYCVVYNIKHVVISPGSRNAPLTINFINHPDIKPYSIVDERCAAFFALGIAQQTQNPTALVCTSGSALLNYYPAIAEAYYSDIPLIIISADRPKHLIDVGDGQTIRQENVFKNHSLFNANLVNEIHSNTTNMSLIGEALSTACRQKGPVHINVPFDEPLYETTEQITISKTQLLKAKDLPIKELDLKPFIDRWNQSNKKMILVGSNYPNALLEEQLSALVKDASVLVLTETTSNLYNSKFINSIDKLIAPLTSDELNNLSPDILITFGGMVVSKKVKQFLRKYPPNHHWHVDTKKELDTYQCLSHHFKIKPEDFLSQLLKKNQKVLSSYQKKWLEIMEVRNEKHTLFLQNAQFSDLTVFDLVLNSLPDDYQLQLANSSVIRYSQLFDLNKSLKVFCNRGTSGIDGSTSTAIGAAHISNTPSVFITGDISFFYDSNALWNSYIKNDFRMILINNSGGNIFRIIDGPKKSGALTYFETAHSLSANQLCKMFDIEYDMVSSEADLKGSLSTFFNLSERPKLIEIITPAESNDEVLKRYFASI